MDMQQPPAIVQPGDIQFSFKEANRPILKVTSDGKITTGDGRELKDLTRDELQALVEELANLYCKGCVR